MNFVRIVRGTPMHDLKSKDFRCFRGFNVDVPDYETGIVFNDNCLPKIFN